MKNYIALTQEARDKEEAVTHITAQIEDLALTVARTVLVHASPLRFGERRSKARCQRSDESGRKHSFESRIRKSCALVW